MAKALVVKALVTFSKEANVKCLARDQITVLKTLGEQNVTDVAKDVPEEHDSFPSASANAKREVSKCIHLSTSKQW